LSSPNEGVDITEYLHCSYVAAGLLAGGEDEPSAEEVVSSRSGIAIFPPCLNSHSTAKSEIVALIVVPGYLVFGGQQYDKLLEYRISSAFDRTNHDLDPLPIEAFARSTTALPVPASTSIHRLFRDQLLPSFDEDCRLHGKVSKRGSALSIQYSLTSERSSVAVSFQVARRTLALACHMHSEAPDIPTWGDLSLNDIPQNLWEESAVVRLTRLNSNARRMAASAGLQNSPLYGTRGLDGRGKRIVTTVQDRTISFFRLGRPALERLPILIQNEEPIMLCILKAERAFGESWRILCAR